MVDFGLVTNGIDYPVCFLKKIDSVFDIKEKRFVHVFLNNI